MDSTFNRLSPSYRSPTLMNHMGSINPGVSQFQNPIPGQISNTLYSGTQPPALPPRTTTQTNSSYMSPYNSGYNSFGGYGSGYGGMSSYGGLSSYGYGGYGGMSSYGGMGSYGYGGYNRFGAGFNNMPPNSFIQQAQESTRPTFESIQSIVNTFSSLTMMLESTYHAFHSSFMAVLGVADNFSKIKSVFGQFFTTFALLRYMNWLLKKILYTIGLRRSNPSTEQAWTQAESGQIIQTPTNWPLLGFVSVIVAAPFLIYKLLASFQPPAPPMGETWNPHENPGPLAVGFYDFRGECAQDLPVTIRQKIMIAPKKYQPTNSPGWLLACNESKKIGLVPANYIGIIMPSDKQKPGYIDHNGQTYPISILKNEPATSLFNSSQVNLGASGSSQPVDMGTSITNQSSNLETIPSNQATNEESKVSNQGTNEATNVTTNEATNVPLTNDALTTSQNNTNLESTNLNEVKVGPVHSEHSLGEEGLNK